MKAYEGQTVNIIDCNRVATPYQSDWQGIKTVQYILKTFKNNCTKDECADLANRIFNSVVESTVESKAHLSMAIKTVMDWNSETSSQSLNPLRSMLRVCDFASDQKLLPWQFALLRNITALPFVSKVLIFEKKGLSYFWVISSNPSTETIMAYSKEYVKIIQEYTELDIDFMVYGEEETSYFQIPDKAFIFNNEG